MRSLQTQCDCGHIAESDGLGTGYGTYLDGKRYCYSCCALRELSDMQSTGKAVLYLTNEDISNWPGTLRFRILHKRVSRHNWGLKRRDVWFRIPQDNHLWHGYQIGDNSQLLHCKRTKA